MINSNHWAAYWKYIYERQAVWHKRFIQKLPRPWTDDKTIAEFSFTNVYRELDRSSLHYIEHVFGPVAATQGHGSDADLFCRIVAARFFNRTDVWDECIGPVLNNPLRDYTADFTMETIEERLREFAKKRPVFTGAYIVCSYSTHPGKDKIAKVCNFLKYIFQNSKVAVETLRKCPTLKDAHKYLQTFPGVGPFNAYEFLGDMLYIPGYLPWTEDDWANPGPGCEAGLLLLDPDRRDFEQEIVELRDQQDTAFEVLGLDFWSVAPRNADGTPRRLTLRSIENCLCEYQKYARGRSRGKFKDISKATTVPEIPR
jgi:hypothetical protein